MNYTDSYVKLTGKHDVISGVFNDIPLLITEPQLKVKAKPDRTVLGHIVLPLTENFPRMRWFSHGNPPPDKETAYPVILAGKFGKGRVVYFASSFENVYLRKGHPYAQRLLANATRWAGGEPPVTAFAPASVELTAFKQPSKNRIIVHLVNFQTEISRSIADTPSVIREVIPVHDVTVFIKASEPVSKVYLAPEKKKLSFKSVNGRLKVKVPKIDIHGMVVVERK